MNSLIISDQNIVTLNSGHSLCLILLMLGHVETQKRQFELAPSLPSNLPSPPDPPKSSGGGGGFHGGGTSNLITGFPNPIPPQNNPPVPGVAEGGPGGPVGPPVPEFAPFGLNHVILILVPQFKTKFRDLPKWVNSNVKVAMPITVFFDKLEVPPQFSAIIKPQVPSLFMKPPLFGGPRPPPPPPQLGPGFGQYPFPYPPPNSQGDDDLDPEADQDDDTDNDDGESYEHGDGYEHEPYEEAEKRALTTSKRRRKRSIVFVKPPPPSPPTNIHSRRKRSVAFNNTIHSSERAVLLPKLENFLNSAGLGGKSCLLRTICEVHEAPLHHYGLLGQLFTMFFSVSRSIFAESHLPEYLQAEKIGRTGNCSEYFVDCDKTMFSWEEPDISMYNEIF